MENCIFCSIVKSNIPHHKIVWNDEKHLAFLDKNPVTEGHTLMIPKKHFCNILDLNKEEYGDLMEASRIIAQVIKDKTNCHLVSMLVEGMSVAHVHVHLIPFKEGEDLIKFVKSKGNS